jgi:rhodanese-related sulfurtransferase
MSRGTILRVLLVVLLIVLAGFLYYNMSSPLAMGPDEAKTLLKDGKFDAVVDVRTDAEWATGHFPLAIHIPVKQLSAQLPQRIPDKNAKILMYCNTSTRARMGAEEAVKLGYKNVRYLLGTHTNLM